MSTPFLQRLFLTKDLPEVIFAYNAADFILTRKEIYSTSGSYCEHIISLSSLSAPADGDTLVFKFNNTTYTFTFKDAPDFNNPFDLGSLTYYGGGGFLLNEISDTVNRLNSNKALADYFTFELLAVSTNSISYFRIKAKNKGAAWDIDFTGTTLPSYSDDTISVGADSIVLSNYSAHARLMVETLIDSGVYENVYEAIGTGEIIEADGTMLITFSGFPKVMQSYLGFDLPLHCDRLVKGQLAAKRFYIEYWEEYGDTIVRYPSSVTDGKWCLNGKMPPHMTPAGDKFIEDWRLRNVAMVPKMFLTNWHDARLVSKDYNGWLSLFLLYNLDSGWGAPSGRIDILITPEYADGFNTAFPLDSILLRNNTDEGIYLIPTGYKSLGLDLWHPSSELKSYTIELRKINFLGIDVGPVTEQYKYIIDPVNSKYNDYYIWQNAFGMPETLWNKGITSREMQLSLAPSDVVNSEFESSSRSGAFIYGNKMDEAKRKNTGNWNKDYILYLDEFIESREVYELEASTDVEIPNKYRRIVVTGNKIARENSDDFLWNMNWEFKYSTATKKVQLADPTFNFDENNTLEIILTCVRAFGNASWEWAISADAYLKEQDTINEPNYAYASNPVFEAVVPAKTVFRQVIKYLSTNRGGFDLRLYGGITGPYFDMSDLNFTIPYLHNLEINGFHSVPDLTDFIRRHRYLNRITIVNCNMSADAVNKILDACLYVRNHGTHFGIPLASVDVRNNTTPNDYGVTAKAALIAAGVTTLTD